MKTLRLLSSLVLGAATLGFAQDAPAPVLDAVQPATAGINVAPLTPEQLDLLLGPIALYPDALIAIILPAATVPTDIVLAARYIRQSGTDLSQVENRAWDESVKSLAHYPDVLKWMDENLPWTKQLGEAFAEQPAEVMKSLQRLRARAQANGALVSTPQQQVIVEQQAIRIVPAEPDVIYVPYYDPAIVYVDRPVYLHSYARPLLTFGVGCRVGSWLAFDFDWHRHTIWVGDRHRHWDNRHDWRRPVVVAPVAARPGYTSSGYTNYRAPRPWTPPPRATRPTFANVQNSPQPQGQLPRTPPLHMSSSYEATGPVAPNQNNETQRPVTAAPGSRRGSNNQVTATAPQPVAVAPTPAPTVTAPANNRGRYDAGARPSDSRPSESRVRTYQPPANASIPSVPPIQMNTPPPASYPTVTAPTRERSYSSPRASAPVAVPPVHVQSPPQYHAPQPAPTVTAPPPPAAAAPAPAPAPAPDRGDRPGRDRRNVD